MAPESERATCKHERLNMEGVCPCGYWVGDPTAHLREPTLTCSEVVERLPISAKEFVKTQKLLLTCDTISELSTGLGFINVPDFAEAYAKECLHSWRERRVQELEEALKLMVEESSPTGVPNRLTRDTFKLATDALNQPNHSGIRSTIETLRRALGQTNAFLWGFHGLVEHGPGCEACDRVAANDSLLGHVSFSRKRPTEFPKEP